MVFVHSLRLATRLITGLLALLSVISEAAASDTCICTHPPDGSAHEISALSNPNLMIVRIDFTDLPGTAIVDGRELSRNEAISIVRDELAPLLARLSQGRFHISTSTELIPEVVRVPETASSYAQGRHFEQMGRDALKVLSERGYDIHQSTFIAFVHSDLSNLPGSTYVSYGNGHLNGKLTWYNGHFTAPIIAHELGHNLGLGHANRWEIPKGSLNPIDPKGRLIEYGDTFDIMGTGLAEQSQSPTFNYAHLHQLGWLPPASWQTVASPQLSRLFVTNLFEPLSEQINALEIPIDSSTRYWLSYQKEPYQEHAAPHLVRLRNEDGTTERIDLLPQGTLLFTDDETGLRIEQRGTSNEDHWIDLAIHLTPSVQFIEKTQTIDDSSEAATVWVERRRNANGPVSVRWSTLDGTASAGESFQASSGELHWETGDPRPQAIQVPLIFGQGGSANHFFDIRLDSAENAKILSSDRLSRVYLLSRGHLDQLLNRSGITGTIEAMKRQPDGKILIVGELKLPHEGLSGVVRLTPNGEIDDHFSLPEAAKNQVFHCVHLQLNGQIWLGGDSLIVRLDEDGTENETLTVEGRVNDLATDPSTRLYVATTNGLLEYNRHLLPAQGTRTSALPPNTSLNRLALSEDGSLFLAGQFGPSAEADSWTGLLHLAPDGVALHRYPISHTESPPRITTFAFYEDGSLAIGGLFTKFGEWNCGNLIRLLPNGDFDNAYVQAFRPGTNGEITGLFVQPNQSLVAAGHFNTVRNLPRAGLARLTSTGALDSWAKIGAIDAPLALAQDPTGHAIVVTSENASIQMERISLGSPPLPGMIQFTSKPPELNRDGLATVLLERVGGDSGTVSVNYTTQPPSSIQGVLTWADGNHDTKTLRVPMPMELLSEDTNPYLVIQPKTGSPFLGGTAKRQLPLHEWYDHFLWLGKHFKRYEQPNDDHDGDGLSNLVEYAFERDPTSPESIDGQGALPSAGVENLHSSGQHRLTITLNLPQTTPPGIVYEVCAQEMASIETAPIVLARKMPHHAWETAWNELVKITHIPDAESNRDLVRITDLVDLDTSSGRLLFLQVHQTY